MFQVAFVVYEKAKMYLVPFHKILKKMPRSNFVTLVGRVWNAMSKKEDARHDC